MNIELVVPDDRMRELDALRDRLGIKTARELINNALTLLEWAVEETASGRSIASVDEADGSYRELQMPILAAVGPATADPATPALSDALRAFFDKDYPLLVGMAGIPNSVKDRIPLIAQESFMAGRRSMGDEPECASGERSP